MNQHYPPIEKDWLSHRLAAGWTDADIALHLGCSLSRVTFARHRYGLPVQHAAKFRSRFRQRYGPEAITQFTAAYEAGQTLAEISTLFGFSREYARQVAKQLGLGRRPHLWLRRRAPR